MNGNELSKCIRMSRDVVMFKLRSEILPFCEKTLSFELFFILSIKLI